MSLCGPLFKISCHGRHFQRHRFDDKHRSTNLNVLGKNGALVIQHVQLSVNCPARWYRIITMVMWNHLLVHHVFTVISDSSALSSLRNAFSRLLLVTEPFGNAQYSSLYT